MEKQLVSFGKFLLANADSRPEAVKHDVTHADIRNWQHETGEPSQWGNLPEFDRGQSVTLHCGDGGSIAGCKVIGFHSYGDKHAYDLAVSFHLELDGGQVNYSTRIRGVESGLLRAADVPFETWDGDNEQDISNFTGQAVSREGDGLLVGNHPDGFALLIKKGDAVRLNRKGQVEIYKR